MEELTLPVEAEQRLQRLCFLTGRSRLWYVREMVLKTLPEMEDEYLPHDNAGGEAVPAVPVQKEVLEENGMPQI